MCIRDRANVSVGDAFESFLRAGGRNGVHNPAEFVMLARAFVILESMIAKLAPEHNYMASFREEVSRLSAQHFSPERIKGHSVKLARDMERFIMDAPGDTRRILRRIAEGDLGRLPGLEALAGRFIRNIERLTSAIAYAALVIGGSMLLFSPMGGWHHALGEAMVISGVTGMIFTAIGAWRHDYGQR